MESFVKVTGIAAPLMRANIDTDLLIPSREITGTGKDGYGAKLLAPWRYLPGPAGSRVENPDFVLNRAPFRQACFLIADANFGSGSSREPAVWAVRQFGLRGIIAPSFGAIFRNNCFRNGVLPIELAKDQVDRLAHEAESGHLVLTVDLEACEVIRMDRTRITFKVPANERTMMLEGLDAIGLTLKLEARIRAFQAADRKARPWIWDIPQAIGEPT
ncbi:3-isopropylmalate dehydratase subunit LeuD [Paraburkholderia unamae]|uniref:3-isopropylmalate dehydratase small subunit n=1 Tax=Paraburkholderia unamae TaxID=219649 RepID=UPI000DC29BD5|nr:3-isopropylmalate dehydratase small subunit [Paraburkholderia unamae]RAR56406.1 3-isopropylmalate dehydratase small subunit [Paraburkholderia unamae]CAG9266116.1 3-isopropylmalate dehydratase subunit LeuD [Paraburkholderia unamae]